ncbi:MAG: hypothetical protein KGI66_02885, partial [Patescibacteria group bacterium]|nr:hypothetical protein [Patescibacteria group bacterium]
MIKKTVIGSVRQTLTLALLLSGSFIILEPALGAAAGSQFTTSETVTSELSFATPASNVTLSPALGGITGGTATGQTQVVVLTNDALGYQMTIQASSSLGMIGNASSTNYIAAYVPASTIPDYTFAVNSPRGAAFGYT